MALEVRLRDQARLTKDLDLGLRDTIDGRAELQERLVDALAVDPFDDRFILAAGSVTELMPDGGGHMSWRSSVSAHLAGRAFGGIQLDVSPRVHELERTDAIMLPNSMAFAGVEAPTVEIIDVNRHAAEKLHAMLRDYGDRENTRVRDLVDLVILVEHDSGYRPGRGGSSRVRGESSAEHPERAPAQLVSCDGESPWPPSVHSLASLTCGNGVPRCHE